MTLCGGVKKLRMQLLPIGRFTFSFSQLKICILISLILASRIAIRVMARQASFARYRNGSTSSNLN